MGLGFGGLAAAVAGAAACVFRGLAAMVTTATATVLAAAVAVFRGLASSVAALTIQRDRSIALGDAPWLDMGLDTCGEEEGGESDRGDCDAHAGSLTPTPETFSPFLGVSRVNQTSSFEDMRWPRAPDLTSPRGIRDMRGFRSDIF